MFYYRPPDQAQAFNMGNDNNSKLRFSAKSPCDCMLFNGDTNTFYTLELKSIGTTGLSFERVKGEKGIIHKYQIDKLLEFSKYKNVISGFLLDFRKSDNTYFLEINQFADMIDKIDKKSFNEKDLLEHCSPTLIEKRKLKVNYRYNVGKFLEDVKS